MTMQSLTAAEALMVNESLRAAVASAQAAPTEAQMVHDPQLRQFLQSEAQRHQRTVQRLQGLIGMPNQ